MPWYAAHLVLYFRRKQEPQARRIRVWENIVLVKAASDDEAFAKAEERGRQDAGVSDDTLRLGDEPAEMVFAGVRKLVLCQDKEKRPTDGTEVTYTEMEVGSEKAVRQLVAGKPVSARLVDFLGKEPAADDVQQPKRCSG